MSSPIVTEFVDAAIAQLRRLDLMRSPGKVPDAMQDISISRSNDWIGWRPIPSTVTEADLDSLEREVGLPFPPLYRDFLKYRHFIELTETALRFIPHLCGVWQETLRKVYFHSREHILDVGLIPFGNETLMDAGPVCFDTRHRASDGDCPIVFLDHEWVGTKKEVQHMFSSCRKMFECLTFVARANVDFIYHDDDDDLSSLPQKRALLGQFLSLDSNGAGNVAREYWTSWGVTPAG